ncbi:MAG TPA: CopD family protein [Methylomirabilota bacterium]
MTGFVDVVLRGAILVLASLVLGGVVWARLIVRAGPGVVPAAPTRLALGVVAAAGGLLALAQTATLLVALTALRTAEDWPLAALLATTFARGALVRIGLGLAVAFLALRLARRRAGPLAWHALGAGAVVLVVSSAVLSHAVARVESRALLLLLDAAHQLTAAVWIGGLAHLTLYAALRARQMRRPRSVGAGAASTSRHRGGLLGTLAGSDRSARSVRDADPAFADEVVLDDAVVIGRFSSLALGSVLLLILAGVSLTWQYVGEWSALVGTAYGVMVLSKVVLLAAILALAALNFRAVRQASAAVTPRLLRLVEVELGLGVTVLFAAASLTSLPPAVDVTTDRATVAEVAERFRPAAPRLTSPPVAELLGKAEPLMAPVTRRDAVERAWSEYNHHWAGFFVLAMGLLSALERLGVRAARHWPLMLLGLAGFLALRSDPRAWPLGPAGFWESFALPDVLQHRTFVLLIVAFAVFEWMVRTGRLSSRPWGYVFPLLCAVGGGLLLTHSHAMFDLKDEFLIEVTHAPIGILGAFLGWGRWLELRLPGAGRGPGWFWTACLIAVGLILLVYREG